MDRDAFDSETARPGLLDEADGAAEPTHRRSELDDDAAGPRTERGDVLERADGEDRPGVLRRIEGRREHDRCRTVRQALQLVHGPDRDRVGELGRDRRQRLTPEPVPVAFDDRHQPRRGVDDRPDVAAPLGAVDRQSHRHDARRYRLSHSPPPRAPIRTERPDAPTGVPESGQNGRARSESDRPDVPESAQNADAPTACPSPDELFEGRRRSGCGPRRFGSTVARPGALSELFDLGRPGVRPGELFELGRHRPSGSVADRSGVGAGAAGPGGEAGDQGGDGAFAPHALPHADAVRHVVGEVDGMAQGDERREGDEPGPA